MRPEAHWLMHGHVMGIMHGALLSVLVRRRKAHGCGGSGRYEGKLRLSVHFHMYYFVILHILGWLIVNTLIITL